MIAFEERDSQIKKLLKLLNVQENSRQVGHTTAAIRGVLDEDVNVNQPMLVVHKWDQAKMLQKEYPGLKCVTLSQLENRSSTFLPPLVFDNCALSVIAHRLAALLEIDL